MRVKAIETSYAGCRFRSRLEARWAVFFDTLGIEWQYEAEGYETAAGRYLPDFWLPGLGHWVEVKGRFTPADLKRTAEALWDMRTPVDKQVTPQLLILGPVPRPGCAWLHVRFDLAAGVLLWQQVFFAESGGYRTRALHQPIVFERNDFAKATNDSAVEQFCRGLVEVSYDERLTVDPDVDRAYSTARAARFEFGASG